MGTIYLIRHGAPDFGPGGKRCIGRTDLPLCVLGRLQAALATAALSEQQHVYTSPLRRAQETACFLSPAPEVWPELTEMDMGAWENLTFPQIRSDFPALYQERGLRLLTTPPPKGESFLDCRARLLPTADRLRHCNGVVSVVAHAGGLRMLLSLLAEIPAEDTLTLQIPYGSIAQLTGENGSFVLSAPPASPRPPLEPPLCKALLQAADTPEPVHRHCHAVAGTALELAGTLSKAGHTVDVPRLQAAALLHDLQRMEKSHAEAAATLLSQLGYPAVGEIVRTHHDLPPLPVPVEALILYLADKMVLGDQPVTIQERFAASLEKCTSSAALEAHRRRQQQAEAAWAYFTTLCRG